MPLEDPANGQTTGWIYVIEDATGILWCGRQGVEQPTAIGKHAIGYSIETGASWNDFMGTGLLPVGEEVPYSATIVGLGKSVAAPAGRLENCLELRFRGEKMIDGGMFWGGAVIVDATDWHCSGAGFVKYMLVQTIDNPLLDLRATRTVELIDYGE